MSLFPAEVKKVSFLIHQSDLEKALDALHERGIVQIIDIKKEKSKLTKELNVVDVEQELSDFNAYELRLLKTINALKPYRAKRGGIKSLLNPPVIERREVKKKSVETLFRETENLLNPIEKGVAEAERRMKSIEDKIKDVEVTLSRLSYLRLLPFDLSLPYKLRHVNVKIGLTKNLDVLKSNVKDLCILEYRAIGEKREGKYIVACIFHASIKEEIEKIWQRYVETLIIPQLSGTPSKLIRELEKEKSLLLMEKKKAERELKRLAEKHLIDLLAKLEELRIEKAKIEAKSLFGRTSTTYLIEGWVVSKDMNELGMLLEKVTGRGVIYSFSNPAKNPEEPPTYIETSPLTKPFKPLLTLFGLPRYNEINPLIFLVLWFPIMFGFMLGDAGYGLVILLASLVAKLKWGKRSSFISTWSMVGIFLGFWTTIFGYLSNSFFGDLLPRFFDTNLPSLSLFGIQIPIDGLRNPLVFLQIALILGLVHLNIGIALAIIQNLRRGDIRELITGQLSFILLQIFGGALLGEYLLKIWTLSNAFETISVIGTLAGIVLLAVKAKGMAFLELMGFVGDWLSYARLLALGLATAGMALAFNIVAELFGEMVHVSISIVILVIAHVVTLGLNSLGAAVHSLRLQYVEFFNRFYEGGGKAFTPFRARRRYTKLV
ncbi:MAG TPA: V-type ATP synthase subunit I [Thermoplasmatales archaeon]|nr:V-type ATP synthase subunit I [Thermoplasmatales archaeon]